MPEVKHPPEEIIPDGIRERCALLDGALHVSAELKGSGNMDLDALVARLKRRGVADIVWVPSKDFHEKYRTLLKNESAGDNELQKKAISLLEEAYNLKASDIHLTDFGKYTLVSFRRLGMLQDYTTFPGVYGSQLLSVIYGTLSKSVDSMFTPDRPQDGRIKREYLPAHVHSVRVHTEPTSSIQSDSGTGMFMALRLLYDMTAARGSLEDRLGSLGFTPEQQRVFRTLTERKGLKFVSGPTGHGKSTVLKHIMESQAETMPEKNYIAGEDPSEYPLKDVKQLEVKTNEEKYGVDVEEARRQAFISMLAGIMRSDPDVIMIGEIRYAEAAQAAIRAALTGHGVWTTVHASNALAIVSYIQSMGVNLDALCSPNVLSGLSYQCLIPLLCPNCKTPFAKQPDAVPPIIRDRLMRVMKDGTENVFVRGPGCGHCRKIGLVGQTVAAEVIATDQKLLELLRRNDFPEARRYWLGSMKGKTHVQHALDLIGKGLADPYTTEIRLGVPLDFDETDGTA